MVAARPVERPTVTDLGRTILLRARNQHRSANIQRAQRHFSFEGGLNPQLAARAGKLGPATAGFCCPGRNRAPTWRLAICLQRAGDQLRQKADSAQLRATLQRPRHPSRWQNRSANIKIIDVELTTQEFSRVFRN
jgi:hypothetical protein